MKELLKKFLNNKSIKPKLVSEFLEFSKNSTFSSVELESFFISEKDKIKARDKIYEANHIRKTIRFSNNEYLIIQEKLDLANIDFSTFAKNTLLETPIILPIEKDLLFEISRIGNNLNQIARAVNQNDKINVLSKLVEIEKEIKKLCM